jgi:hypothetical protein
VFEIHPAKEIKGAPAAPPSSDLFFLSLALAFATGATARISPVRLTPRVSAWTAAFRPFVDIAIDGEACSVSPRDYRDDDVMRLSYEDIPYRDCVVFFLMGRLKALRIEGLPPKRFERWERLARKAGCMLHGDNGAGVFTLILDKKDHFKVPDLVMDVEEAHVFLGLALGLKARVEFIIDQGFSSPLRQALPSFGWECAVKNNAQNKTEDQLIRRFRFLKTGKKSEGPVQFSVNADFSIKPLEHADVTLPGDDVFAALLILAKCLAPKGSLVIENVSLESWNTQALQLLKTMGGVVGTQETSTCSFGSVGTVIVQKMNFFGRKIECRPWWQYAAQLPIMIVMAAFAQGQTIFRNLEDPREDSPDGVERLIACICTLGARYGEMPDGIVIEGSKQFDGFDLRDRLPAPIAAAFVVAALKCRGTSTIADEHILSRWPDFKETFYSLCDFKD